MMERMPFGVAPRATRIATLACVLACTPAAAASAQERGELPPYRVVGDPASLSDARDIEALMQRFTDAWARQDADAVVATHAVDVEWINAYARVIRGSSALRTFLADRLFPSFDRALSRGEARGMTPVSRRYLGDDAVVLHWYSESRRGASRDAGTDARRTHLHFVLAKRDGEWRIVHVAIFDARSS